MKRWTLPQSHLASELSIALAQRLTDILASTGDADHIGPGYVHHMYSSAFEDGCDVLWSLGVARAAWGPEPDRKNISFSAYVSKNIREKEKMFAPYFVFLPVAKIREHISSLTVDGTPQINEILSVYLKLFCSYGNGGTLISSGRRAFTPPQQCEREINALLNAEYMTEVGSGVQWTKKIAAAMQAAYLWQEDGLSSDDIAAAELEANAQAAWHSMPDTIRKAYFSNPPFNTLAITAILARGWKDDRWDLTGDDGTVRLSGEIQLARRLIEISSGKR